MSRFLLPLLCGLLLAGCEQLGIEDPSKIAAAREAEGRAVGGACRHSGRALEACYDLNRRASKAAIFTGWRDMDAYMRENNIEIIPPPGSQKNTVEPTLERDDKAKDKPAQKSGAAYDLPPSTSPRAKQA